MSEPPPNNHSNFLTGTVVGVLAGLMLGGVFGEFYGVQPKWKSHSITANFVHVKQWETIDLAGKSCGVGDIELQYALKNHTNTDYLLKRADNPMVMILRDQGYEAEVAASLLLPIFVPANTRVIVTVKVPYASRPMDELDEFMLRDPSRPLPKRLIPAQSVVRTKLGAFGLAVFDPVHKVRIDLPRAW